ncbi:cytochrome P450 [Actinomadura geliboluensis]|uniref:Cytochrome P450 n=1 Tax=Actinomadura geliboluensis TaxID=882440 RepID=A0A5S4GTL2_9ACTN|nr:cytochrome P450 [Actinomadura geliboluensis]TMR36285.1 cytochrome P450 [Actinomadura geliboluensis]
MPVLDDTLPLLSRPYGLLSARARRLDTDVYDMRLLLRKTTCMTGADAARVFYDPDRFVREGAAPRRLRVTLFGENGVQGLDGRRHAARKRMFMSLMTPEARDELRDLTGRAWRKRIGAWRNEPRVVLFDEVSELLCSAVCAWAGVPLAARQVPQISRMLVALIEAPAAVGPRYLRGRTARRLADRWAAAHVTRARERHGRDASSARGAAPGDGTALDEIAAYRDTDGSLLPPDVAGVELLNVLRPTVAVARFVVFAAMALHDHPEWQRRLATDDDPELLEAFVQEVRRFYPFFPLVAARAARDFEWRGHYFPKGRRVLLDLHGTDHDPRLWDRPEQFKPERFIGRTPDAYSLIPQGGGDHFEGHRCAGEWVTKDVMKTSVTALTRWMSYQVPPQDLSIHPWRAPALPKSRFVIARVAEL